MQKPCNMPWISSSYAPKISSKDHASCLQSMSKPPEHKSWKNVFMPRNLKVFIPLAREPTVHGLLSPLSSNLRSEVTSEFEWRPPWPQRPPKWPFYGNKTWVGNSSLYWIEPMQTSPIFILKFLRQWPSQMMTFMSVRWYFRISKVAKK